MVETQPEPIASLGDEAEPRVTRGLSIHPVNIQIFTK
jgi:hypothetical protein